MREQVDTQAVAVKCTFCEEFSKYDRAYNDKLPQGWRDLETGYQCNNCRKAKEGK